MATTGTKIEPKTIGLIVAVVVALALAIWQGTKAMSSSATDVSYTPKVKPPPESTVPPGTAAAASGGEDKTGAGG